MNELKDGQTVRLSENGLPLTLAWWCGCGWVNIAEHGRCLICKKKRTKPAGGSANAK